MNKNFFHITRMAFAMAIVTTTLIAQAQSGTSSYNKTSSTYTPGSTYVGLNGGKSDYSLGNGLGVFASDQGDTAYGLNIGNYFNPNMGLELGYTNLGRVNRGGGTTRAEGISLSLLGKFPMSNALNLLGKIGSTWGNTSVSADPMSGIATGDANGFGLSYGLGLEFVVSPQWSAVLQYDSHNLNFAGDQYNRVGVTTLGLRYSY